MERSNASLNNLTVLYFIICTLFMSIFFSFSLSETVSKLHLGVAQFHSETPNRPISGLSRRPEPERDRPAGRIRRAS